VRARLLSRIHDLVAQALQALPAEDAHRLTLAALRAGLGPRATQPDEGLATDLAGLKLPVAIGLAAGFDKNADAPTALLKAGFGFVECGTVTPLPQAGNPRPRLFRLKEDQAVVNRMGFNNVGLKQFAIALARSRGGIVGANVGANRDSKDRIGDYVIGLKTLWRAADYFTINVSSPNTPGLRDLQEGGALQDLLGRIAEARAGLGGASPLFLKVAPDLSEAQIEAIADEVAAHQIDGVIVGNTTVSRPSMLRSSFASEAGGLSGSPLMRISTEALARFREAARGRFVLVGVGGIGSGADAYAKIRAGAQAVQLYTALVFPGPGLIVRLRRELVARLRADGFSTIAEAAEAR
jgi:dihydroorotate dehydrogenase